MPKHNSGRDKSGQNKTKKKRQADQGKRRHKNKYEDCSHAAQEQDKIARQGEAALNTRYCKACYQQVRVCDWDSHPCNRRSFSW